MWSVVTRFPASGCLKCHYSSHSSSDLVCVIDSFILRNLPNKNLNLNMATNLLNCKQRSPRVLLTPLRLPSVSSLHLPGVSCKKLFTTTKVTLFSPSLLVLQIPNLSQFLTQVGLQSPFRLANRINRGFSKISTCNARRCLTCHHISCKSTITSSINGNRYGIQIDKDVD